MNYVITCCSTCDLNEQHVKDRDLHYISFHAQLGDKTILDDFGKTMPMEDFYNAMEEGADTRTSQINQEEYEAFFESFLKEGKDIVHVSLSSGISGTVNAARLAKEVLSEKYPDRKLYIIDSLAASSGYGLLMDEMADRRDEGMSIEELVEWTEKNKKRVHHWFFSTTLKYYIRGGRVSKTAGIFGTLLNICPLLNVDYMGRLIPRDKIRTKKRVIQEIVKRMEEHADGGLDYSGKVYISQSACYEDAKAVADLVEATFPKLKGKVEIYWIGATIGAHTGPGTVALFFMGDERVD